MGLTITEALAEIKTIGKRLEKKRESIGGYLARQEGIKDPLEKDGGSEEFVKRERQAIADLETRIITLRSGISAANDATLVNVNGVERSISDWLTWRREVAPGQRSFLNGLRNGIKGIREEARRKGADVIAPGATANRPTDVIINIDEGDLAGEIEALEEAMGQLDGLLSLKNATIQIKE